MSRLKDQLLVIAVLVIGLLAASMASAHGGDTTRIHACINNSSGTIHTSARMAPATATKWRWTGTSRAYKGRRDRRGLKGHQDRSVQQDQPGWVECKGQPGQPGRPAHKGRKG